MMSAEIQALCLRYIADEWRKLPTLHLRDKPPMPPPWGVWIQLYAPISYDQIWIRYTEDSLQKVWFLDKHGCKERDPWEYARFIAVTSDRPWAAWGFAPPEAIWGTVHEIGLAAFTNFIEEPDRIYVETQWGDRWGQAYRMVIDEHGALQIEKTLWLS